MIPTVVGREDHLARCQEVYETRSANELEILVLHDYPACGPAWNDGAAKATGIYLHWTADDLEPHPGWDTAAIEAVERGMVPSPALYHPDGQLYFADGETNTLPADWTPGCDHEVSGSPPVYGTTYVPFCSREQYERIGPTIDAHYGTDCWFSYRARKVGYPVVFRSAYAFTHHHAMPGRGAGMGEMERHMYDTRILEAAVHADAD